MEWTNIYVDWIHFNPDFFHFDWTHLPDHLSSKYIPHFTLSITSWHLFLHPFNIILYSFLPRIFVRIKTLNVHTHFICIKFHHSLFRQLRQVFFVSCFLVHFVSHFVCRLSILCFPFHFVSWLFVRWTIHCCLLLQCTKSKLLLSIVIIFWCNLKPCCTQHNTNTTLLILLNCCLLNRKSGFPDDLSTSASISSLFQSACALGSVFDTFVPLSKV